MYELLCVCGLGECKFAKMTNYLTSGVAMLVALSTSDTQSCTCCMAPPYHTGWYGQAIQQVTLLGIWYSPNVGMEHSCLYVCWGPC